MRRSRSPSTPRTRRRRATSARSGVRRRTRAIARHDRHRHPGRQDRGAAARHRQARRAEHILSKPGPLTQEEFQKIRIHRRWARKSSAACRSLPGVAAHLSHHERWDARISGRPQGDEIPLGRGSFRRRLLRRVMSERPYHKAMSLDAALGLLRQEAGKALDRASSRHSSTATRSWRPKPKPASSLRAS